MMVDSRIVSAGISLLFAAVWAAPQALAGEPDAEAASVEIRPMTDALGFSWDMNAGGAVGDGSNDCFDGGLALKVNGVLFAGGRASRLTGRDGYLLEGQAGGLQVKRRVALDSRSAVLWYLESFTNPGTRPAEVTAAIETTLGGNAARVLASDGADFSGALGRGQSGLLAVSSGDRPSVLFLAAAPRGRVRPAVTVEGNRVFRLTYSLAVPPGGTVSLLHAAGQRRGTAAEEHLRVFEKLCRGAGLAGAPLPAGLRATVVNFAVAAGEEVAPGGPHLAEVLALGEALGVERDRHSVLVLKGGAQLTGRASGGRLRVETSGGPQELALDEVALLVGRGGTGRPPRVFLRSGEILAGAVTAPDLALETSSGLRMAVDVERVEALFTDARAGDGVAPKGVTAFVSTQRGARLAVSSIRPPRLEMLSPWGRLSLPPDDIDSLVAGRGALGGSSVRLADGTGLQVFLLDGELELDCARFGTVRLAAWELSGLSRVAPGTEPAPVQAAAVRAGTEGVGIGNGGGKEGAAPEAGDSAGAAGTAGGESGAGGGGRVVPILRLAGGSTLAGEPAPVALEVTTASGRSEVDPRQVLRMSRCPQDETDRLGRPLFALELEGGQGLVGGLAPELLAVRFRAGVLGIPVGHLLGFSRLPPGEVPRASGAAGDAEPSPLATIATTAAFGDSPGWGRRPVRLVPAQIRSRSDELGFAWDICGDGSVNDGTDDCFDGGLKLQVNGARFRCASPQMTPDGAEYVFRWNVNGLDVERWVRLDAKVAAVRYVEVFRNGGSRPVAVNAAVHSCLGSNCQSVWTDKGRDGTGGLAAGECGVAACNGAAANPTVLFLAAGPSSRLRPQVSVNGNRQFAFGYEFSVPPGRSVAILHVVAQRRTPEGLDPRRLTELYKPLVRARWLNALPGEVRAAVANAGGLYPWDDGRGGAAITLEALGVPPGERDVLLSGGDTRLAGRVSCAELAVESRMGRVSLPFGQAIALVGGAHPAGRPCVILRDGQVLAGKVTARGLRFESEAGPALDLSVERLDRLVLRETAPDATPGRPVALVETTDGQRLALAGAGGPGLRVSTAWGPMDVPFGRLQSLKTLDGEPGFLLRLVDGSRLGVLLGGQDLRLETALFGPVALSPWQVRSIAPPRDPRESAGDAGAEDIEVEQPYVRLAGGGRLVGEPRQAELRIETHAGAMAFRPRQIRTMEPFADDSGQAAEAGGPPLWRVTLWNGDTVVGHLVEPMLAMENGGRIFNVPVRDLAGFVVPVPEISPQARERVRELIAGLGERDWQKRETASTELARIGLAAKPLVRAAIAEAKDPEVRRRLEAVLDAINGIEAPAGPATEIDEEGNLRPL